MRNLVAYNPNAVVCEYYAMEHKPSSIQESIIAAITVMCTGVISALSLAKFSTCRTVWLLRHVGSATVLMVALAIGFVGVTTIPAAGDQIYVQQSGTYAAGGEPNFIIDLGSFVTGSSGSFIPPLLIVVAQYNGVGTPTISYSGCSTPSACPLATIGIYGLTSNNGTATLTSSNSSTDTVYSQLGLNAGSSDKFGNLSTGATGGTDPYTTIGLATPTSFSLYAFKVPATLNKGTISLDTTATIGSYIFAYACQSDPGSGKICPNGRYGYGDTPYTNSGFIDGTPDKIPEPSSWALLAAGLLGFAVLRGRARFVR